MKQNIWYNNKSLRLKEYDYNYPGAYFVTICIKNRKCLFGEIVNYKTILNGLGNIAEAFLIDIPNHIVNTEIATHVVMPNHVHAIINIYEKDDVVQTHAYKNNPVGRRHACESQRHAFDLQGERKHEKLPVIIGSYKSAVSKEIHKISHSFKWQRSYHDHIIRNEKALGYIYHYIKHNPENWDKDLENEMYLKDIPVHEREKRLKQFYNRLAE
jgi:REP element-mobilizing transposase RayT